MTSENNSFYKKKKIDVTVEVDGETLHGKLEYGDFGIPTFCLKTLPDTPAFYNHVCENAELTCTEFLGRKTFVLHEIELKDGFVFAGYLTMGDPLPLFDKLELHLTGISVWIEGRRNFHLNGDRLERDISKKTFSESFNFRSASYMITTDLHINTHTDASVKCHFEIEHTLVVQKTQGGFSLKECKEMIHELRNLFSLLVGHSLSVNNARIFSHENPSNYQWLYFPSVLYSQEPLKYSFEAICDFSSLTEGKKWANILSQYFSNDTFRSIWNRLVPSYGKMGVWEYDILSRVVMLEMYAAIKTTDKKLKLAKELNRDFMQALQETITTFSDSKKISGNDLIVFEGMAKAILNTRNTSLPTLREKYDALMAQLSTSLKEAISFTDEDFGRIKTIRDSTAHGFEYERHSMDEDISHEMQLSDRLLILLMCFVYLELDFSETEIAMYLQQSHCVFIRNAGLNTRELSRLSNSAVFIKLSEPPKNLVLKNYDIVVVNHSAETDTWRLNEEITQQIPMEWRKSGISELLVYVRSVSDHNEIQTFETVHQAYIESEGVETEHFGTVIIHQ